MNDKSLDHHEDYAVWRNLASVDDRSIDLSADMYEELRHWLDTGQITIDTNIDMYFNQLGRYPIGLNRIDWRGVRDHLVYDVLLPTGGSMTAHEHEKKLAECRGILCDWLKSNSIGLQEQIIWLGDDCNVALHMTIDTLLESYTKLFSWPQHHYVLPPSVEWCLNYTIEGQLYFGKAENVIIQGCVDLDSPDIHK